MTYEYPAEAVQQRQEALREIETTLDALRIENAQLREALRPYLYEHRQTWAGLSERTAERRRKTYGDGTRPLCPCDLCHAARAVFQGGTP